MNSTLYCIRIINAPSICVHLSPVMELELTINDSKWNDYQDNFHQTTANQLAFPVQQWLLCITTVHNVVSLHKHTPLL